MKQAKQASVSNHFKPTTTEASLTAGKDRQIFKLKDQ